METQCVFIFCQENLLSSYISTFEDMRCKDELIDFKITVQNRSFCGHRLILAAGIPYFRKLFSSSEREMVVDDIDPNVLESVISFAYSGKIEITNRNVRSLLSASKYLQLQQVHDACWEFLEKILSLYNVMEIRNLADKYNCPKLVDISDHYMRSNFEAFAVSANFLKLEFAFFKEVIGRDDVCVSTEEKVFEAVIRWVQVSPSERKSVLPELLTAVRLPLVTPDYLIERVCSEELVTTSRDCMKLVDEVKNYHLSTNKRSQFSSFVTRPRLYATKSQYAASADDMDVNIYALCESRSGTSVKVLDSRNGKWTTSSKTQDVYQAIDHVIGSAGKIYTFSRRAVKVFDVKTLAWQTVDETQMGLFRFGATLHKNKIYFFGGDLGVPYRVLCFDTLVNKWFKEEFLSLGFCSDPGVSSLGRYIYFTGGLVGDTVNRAVERYDPELKKWTGITAMISPRYDHACCSLNGKVYVCGGWCTIFCSGLLSSAEDYDPLTKKWNSIRSMENPKNIFSLVPYDGKLYAHKRQSKMFGEGDIEIYDPKYDQWEIGIDAFDEENCYVFLVSAAVASGN